MKDVASQITYEPIYRKLKIDENKKILRIKQEMYALVPDLIHVIEDGLYWAEER